MTVADSAWGEPRSARYDSLAAPLRPIIGRNRWFERVAVGETVGSGCSEVGNETV
jgi:hypothetical protein